MQIVKHIIIWRFSKTKVMVALSVTENHKSRYVKMMSVPNLKGITVGKFAEKT